MAIYSQHNLVPKTSIDLDPKMGDRRYQVGDRRSSSGIVGLTIEDES